MIAQNTSSDRNEEELSCFGNGELELPSVLRMVVIKAIPGFQWKNLRMNNFGQRRYFESGIGYGIIEDTLEYDDFVDCLEDFIDYPFLRTVGIQSPQMTYSDYSASKFRTIARGPSNRYLDKLMDELEEGVKVSLGFQNSHCEKIGSLYFRTYDEKIKLGSIRVEPALLDQFLARGFSNPDSLRYIKADYFPNPDLTKPAKKTFIMAE